MAGDARPAGAPAGGHGARSARRARGPIASFAQHLLLASVATLVSLLLLEMALRVYHGELFRFSSLLPPTPNRASNPAASYDERLGWVPRVGDFEREPDEKWTITPAGLRSNGDAAAPAGQPIVVVGDSFTFGDEVLDHETWPAQLQQLLGVPVLNGGVFAYGLDQAYLRACALLEQYAPEFVVLAFISDDISRAEFAFYSGWKPYFEYVDGVLSLQNVPVPRETVPQPEHARLRQALSYSHLFHAVLSRVAPRWWSPVTIVRRHHDGERVAVDLFARLDSAAAARDAELLVVALGTNGRISGNARATRVVEQAMQRGIHVLDLVGEISALPADSAAVLFRPRGHYGPALNARVAARIAERLGALRQHRETS